MLPLRSILRISPTRLAAWQRPALLNSVRHYATPKTATTTAEETSSSLLGSLTPNVSTKPALKSSEKNSEGEFDAVVEQQVRYVQPADDADLQKYLHPKPYKTVEALLSPLKRRLYLDNVAQNGFFKNDALVTLQDSTKYRLRLSREEIEALEPSIYLRSWRIKSSVKKTNIVLRALKGLPLKKAITQLHFMDKKVARDLWEMLERGLEDAKKMDYNPDSVYVDQSWVHTDGHWSKELECKGRGRTGIIRHRWVSARFLLKTQQTKDRLAWEAKQRVERKIEKTVPKLVGPATGYYKW